MVRDYSVKVRLTANASDFNKAMLGARAAVRGLTDEIDTSNDRTTWFAQSILALGPTFVPLAAAAVPVLAGIATQATLAVGAVGAIALAFNGVGDAFKAVNEYQLDPSTANLEKMHETLNKIGADGAEFVAFLDAIGPQFAELSDAARAGMFPGITEGLREMLEILPEVETIITNISEAIGELATASGEGLTGSGFADFFTWLEQNAKPLLIDLGNTLGNFAEGFAAMLVGFDPLTQSFSDGLLRMSESFATWAHGLSESSTFHEFIDYVQQSGPMMLHFFGQLVDAFVEVAKAAAPVGDILVPVLGQLLEIIGSIAATPLGPVLIGITAVASAIGRIGALGVLMSGGVVGKMFTPMTNSLKTASHGMGREIDTIKSNIAGIGSVWGTAGARTARETSKITAHTKQLGGALGGLASNAARVAGPMAGMGLMMTGLADDTGLANTASLALLGTMAPGPWGIAIGATAGLVMDMAAANNNLADSVRVAQDVMDTGTFVQMADALGAVGRELDAFESKGAPGWLKAIPVAGAWADMAFGWVHDGQAEEGAEQLESLRTQFESTQSAARELAAAMGINITGSAVDQFNALQQVMTAAQPTMDMLGYTWDQLAQAFALRENGLEGLIPEGLLPKFNDMLAAIVTGSDTAGKNAGRMADEIATAFEKGATSAERFAQAIEMANAALDKRASIAAYEQAIDDARKTYKDMVKEIGNTKNLFNNKGMFNLDLENARVLEQELRDIATEGLNMAKTMGAFEGKKYLRSVRDDIVNTAVMMGMSRDVARQFARYLLQLDAIEAAPKVDMKKEAFDNKARAVNSKLHALGAQSVFPEVDLKDNASPKIQHVKSLLASLRDKDITVTTYLATVHRPAGDGYHDLPKKNPADGTTVPDDGRGYSDRFPFLLAPLEEVVSNRKGQADNFRPELKDINAGLTRESVFNRMLWRGLADGGTAGGVGGTGFGPEMFNNIDHEVKRRHRATSGVVDILERERKERLRVLKGHVHDSEKFAALQKKQLDALREFRDSIVAASDSLSESIASKFAPDAGRLNPAASFADALANIVESDKRRSREYLLAVDELRRIGLSETALQAFLDESSADQVIDFAKNGKLTDAQIAELNNAQFGGPTLSNLVNSLGQQKMDADLMAQMTLLLKSMGVDGDALTFLVENFTGEQLKGFINEGGGLLQQYEDAFNATDRSADFAGQTLAFERFGDELAAANVEVRLQRQETQEANRIAREWQKKYEQLSEAETAATKKVGKDVADALDGKAKKAGQIAGMF